MIPGQGAKIPHASRPKNQNIKKQKQYCNKFNKDFKNGPHQKKNLKKMRAELKNPKKLCMINGKTENNVQQWRIVQNLDTTEQDNEISYHP